jgi:hypothetical protein
MTDDVGKPLVAPPGFASRLTALARATPQVREQSRAPQAIAVGVRPDSDDGRRSFSAHVRKSLPQP